MAPGVKGCLLARKVMCCVEKVCKGFGDTPVGVSVEVVQPISDHKLLYIKKRAQSSIFCGYVCV